MLNGCSSPPANPWGGDAGWIWRCWRPRQSRRGSLVRLGRPLWVALSRSVQKVSAGPPKRQRFALRLCPTRTPPISRPGATYPSRWSLNAELWVRSFQLLTHSSADDQDFAQNWMCWAPAIADEYYFVSSKHYFAQNKISNLTVIFSRFIAEAFSVSTETADRPPPRQRIEPGGVDV